MILTKKRVLQLRVWPNLLTNSLFNSRIKIPKMGIPLFNSIRIRKISWEYFYYPHAIEADYYCVFNEARKWCLENDNNLVITTTRIYYIKEASLRKSVFRKHNKKRNFQELYNTYSSNNKILNKAQEKAIR
jgi:hypothetical protein